uniref:Adenine DNA glycosylase n=1 Tax=uncultured Elusimicrobia bacterium TaxID=699876 RepID=A0A650ENE7_9BACT|nr:A/G-specific adenine glycosylase [uncultured Elusimicrobia bacterium]
MQSLAAIILAWYDQNKRDLPWRNTRDPYLIWLSEIILQQTRVVQGLAYYLRFSSKYPTPRALAAAPEDDVLKLWQGLGYYSRARNLHAAAKSMNGGVPSTYEGVRALKGVGDYTAAAICSIAYGLPYAVLDGNVYRVLSRVFAISTPIDSPAGKKEFSALAQKLLDVTRPGDYNQAVMDFGATLCTPQAPACLTCPLALECKARQQNRAEDFPVKGQKTKISSRYFYYIYVDSGRDTFLHKRGAGDVWQNLYEPVLIETAGAAEDIAASSEYKRLFGRRKPVLAAGPVKHVLSHRVIYAELYQVKVPPSFNCPSEYIRVPKNRVKEYAVSRLVQKLLEKTGLI